VKRALWTIPIVLLVIPVLAYGFGRDPSFVPSPLVNHPAPNFTLTSLDGRRVSLSSFRGQPVIINFWASWCVACRQEQPAFVAAYHHWKHKVAFLGIVYQDSRAAARSYSRASRAAWPSLVDSGQQVAVNFGVTGIPETFFINRRGEIVSKKWNLTPAMLSNGISRIIRRA
jgi:cytochrome c biogenesis protein CcmG, thiol:disulfide interchange protein DsbE